MITEPASVSTSDTNDDDEFHCLWKPFSLQFEGGKKEKDFQSINQSSWPTQDCIGLTFAVLCGPIVLFELRHRLPLWLFVSFFTMSCVMSPIFIFINLKHRSLFVVLWDIDLFQGASTRIDGYGLFCFWNLEWMSFRRCWVCTFRFLPHLPNWWTQSYWNLERWLCYIRDSCFDCLSNNTLLSKSSPWSRACFGYRLFALDVHREQKSFINSIK